MSDTFTLPNEECIKISDEDYRSDLEKVEDVQWGNGRWSIIYRLVLRRKSDDTYWAGEYEVGATEMQDNGGWDGEPVTFKRVYRTEKVVYVYEEAK